MSLRSEVIASFVKLHRTCKQVFSNDVDVLAAARKNVNEGFRKNKHEVDGEKIQELIKTADEVERILRTEVVQAERTDDGIYKLKITKDTLLEDNVPYEEDVTIPVQKRHKKCVETSSEKT